MTQRKHYRNLLIHRPHNLFEAMEPRQFMSASGVPSVDAGGPIEAVVQSNGIVYVSAQSRSGSGTNQIWSAGTSKAKSKLLVDFSASSETHTSIADLTALPDGRVFFTANGGDGHQLYQLNTKGGYTQITHVANGYMTRVTAVSNKLFLYDSGNEKIITLDTNNAVKNVTAVESTPTMWSAKSVLFFMTSTSGLMRTDGTSAGTYSVSGGLSLGSADVFAANDFIYMEGHEGNNTSLYRSDGSVGTPTKLADDFALQNTSHTEIGNYVYFSGGYYNTSPLGRGQQLYRVKTSTGEVALAADLGTSNGSGVPAAIAGIGTNIYFSAGDGDYLTSQGTTDRELYRYDTLTGVTKKITTGELLYPVDDAGAGVLSSYYFVAAPDKDDARFGSRALYRTNPVDDSIEQVGSLPTTTEGTVTGSEITQLVAGGSGLFAVAQTEPYGTDTDVYFVATPYSYIDPTTHVLTIEATEASDTLDVRVVGNELIMNLNGQEERQTVGTFGSIAISLKAGDDKLTTNANVTIGMSVAGDAGNDTIATGSGNDSILGGAGKNFMFGGAGDDRLRGSSGVDYMEGNDGKDRLYGRAGNDILHGGNGVDVLYGDDSSGPFGNDVIYGESSNDKIYAYGGDDQIYGGNQNDSIEAGDGNDTVYGQDGNDYIDGGAGNDDLWGGDGDDTFIANDDAMDRLYGGNGNDNATRDTAETVIDLIEL